MHQCEPEGAGTSWRGHQVESAEHPQHSHMPDTQHLDRGDGTGTQSADDGNCQQDIEDPFILILFFLHNSEMLFVMMKKKIGHYFFIVLQTGVRPHQQEQLPTSDTADRHHPQQHILAMDSDRAEDLLGRSNYYFLIKNFYLVMIFIAK